MNADVKQEQVEKGMWDAPRHQPDIDDLDLLSRWKVASDAIRRVASDNGWTKAEVSRRSEIANSTLSDWYDGKYTGRWDTTTTKVENFLSALEAKKKAAAAIPKVPAFMETKTSRELLDTFTYAQMLPTIAVVTLSAGMGKTITAERYKRDVPHVFMATMRPTTKSVYSMIHDLAHELGVSGTTATTIDQAITDKLRNDGHNSLLIIDEAQNLSGDCVNQLRYYRDIAKCGLVFLGNEEVQERYAVANTKSHSPQMQRRIGRRIVRMISHPEDINSIVMAWGMKDKSVQEIARIIAGKPGALGTLTETIQAASIIAAGQGRQITSVDMAYAWENRSGEIIR